MPAEKYLIVNADDFGQSRGVNRGVIQAHESGIVTSASLMVRWPDAADAAAYGREHSKLSLGLHVDLGEWAYREGSWVPLYQVVPMDDIMPVKEEVARQLATFHALVGKHPTHIDSHQHVHLREPVRSVLVDISRDMAIPLRHFNPEIHYCGNFYGQTTEGSSLPEAITVEGLIEILGALPDGLTELGCHPGTGNDLDAMYNSERAQEVKTLCDSRVQTAIVAIGIQLCSFGSLSGDYRRRLDVPG